MGTTDVAGDVDAARTHHRRHGDMDGHTCLLAKCALHYPRDVGRHTHGADGQWHPSCSRCCWLAAVAGVPRPTRRHRQ